MLPNPRKGGIVRDKRNGSAIVHRERRHITEEDCLLAELANAYLPIENGAEAAELLLLDFIMRAREITARTAKNYVRENCWVEEEEVKRGMA